MTKLDNIILKSIFISINYEYKKERIPFKVW
jgi:hypothetical protein